MCFRIPVVRDEASAVVTHSHSLLSRGPPKAASVWEQGRGPAPLKHTHITIHSLSLYSMTFLFLLGSSRVYYSPGLHQFDPELYIHTIYILYWWESILETKLHLTFPVVGTVLLS